MRDALFFLRTINDVGSTAEILGNLPLRNIVTTALSLPAQIARQSVDKQILLIEAKFDFNRAKNTSNEEGIRSKLDILNEDIASVSGAQQYVGEALSVAAALEERLALLRTTLQDLPNVTSPTGVKATEITHQTGIVDDLLRQKGLLAAAETGITTTRSHIDDLNAIYAKVKVTEDQTELDQLKSDFNRLVNLVTGDSGTISSASYADPQSAQTENLLRSGGDVGAGIDALSPTSVTTIVKSDGTAAVSSSSDLSTFLTDIARANTKFQAITLATAAADAATSEADFDTAESDFENAEFLNSVNQGAFNSTVGGVDFAKALNSNNISGGLSAIDDALSRTNTAQSALEAIRVLAKDAQADGADLVDINNQYDGLISQLTSAFNTPGSATDGTSTFTFDNLLADGSKSYDIADGNLATANGFDLDTTILAALPASITVGNAATLQASVTDTYAPELEATVNKLKFDRPVFAFAGTTMDPCGAVDAQTRQISDDLDTLISTAERNDKNLLNEFESDQILRLGSVATTLTVSAERDFESNLRSALDSVKYVILSSGSQSDRERLLNDALFAVSSTVSSLKGEQFAPNLQSQILDSQKADQNVSAEAGFLKPLENEQYLVRKDAEAPGVSFGPVNNNAALVGLIQQIAPAQGLNLNLVL
jgi:hypothetical protein